MKTKEKLHSVALASVALILCLIFVSSTVSAATEQSASPKITITQITTSGLATHPDIYSDKIVWEEDYKNGYASDIYVYNLSTSKLEASFGASGPHPLPVIYGNTIVWVDLRNGHREGDRYIESRDIYMYDLSTRKETLITEPPKNAGGQDIYGNRIVWEDGTRTVNIYMYDISTHYLHNITQLGTWRSSINPAIYGERVVYQDGRNGYPQIYMYNNSTQTETQISSGVGLSPAIYGDRIVWQDATYNEGNIHMYDLSTSQETQITTSGAASNPKIYGDRIVWEDYRISSPNIYMYDISTSQETQVTTSGLATDPAIYDNRIVWAYGRYRESDIYMGTISEEEPKPILPVANFSSNVSEGYAPLSVQFTGLSQNVIAWNWNFGDGGTSTDQSPMHTFSAAGIYTVNLTVSNSNGTDSKLATINVSEKPVLPVANFSAKPTSGKAPLTVAFTEKSTGSPTSWKWSFGDGTTSTTRNPKHKYSKAGNYTVSLKTTNDAGSNTKKLKNYIKVTTNTRPGIYSKSE